MVVLVEGVGAMDVAGTLELMADVEGLGELPDGTFGCLPKALELRSMWSKKLVMAVEVMMASISFVMEMFKFALLFVLFCCAGAL